MDSKQTSAPQVSGPSSQSGSTQVQAVLNPECWLDQYGDALFRYAAARVRDRSTAEDLVQDAFLAGIESTHAFAGRSSERAWLFGILRNKLANHYRQRARDLTFTELESANPEEQGAFASAGLGRDGWNKRVAPSRWETPDQALINNEFQHTLKVCLSRMPDAVQNVFWMREVDEVGSDEICKELGLSANNVWVILHWARLGLRRCLEVHWFASKPKRKQPQQSRQPPVD